MTEFITRNYGQKEFEVIIKTDSKEHYKEAQDFARKLIDHAKPQTNADRIRAMSDEELAELFMAIIHESDVLVIEKLNRQGIEASLVEAPDHSMKAHLEWLKQPADMRGEEDGK